MTPILTPKDIISHLLAADKKTSAFPPWSYRLQQWLTLIAIISFVIGAVLAVTYRHSPDTSVRWWALGVLAFSQIAAALTPLAVILPAVRTFGKPTKTIADPVLLHFNTDVQSITDLAQTYDQHHLDFARDRLAQVVEQLRYRVGFMIGAVEKVGILPSSVTGYFYAQDILQKPAYASSGIEGVFIAFVAFYIVAMVFLIASQRVERAALVAKHAAEKKQSDMRAKDSKADA